jgi:raffinose/stachyose/melibiose transport system permease protein
MDSRNQRALGGDSLFNSVSITMLSIALIACFYPFCWMMLNSFKTQEELFQYAFGLPKHYDLTVFVQAWKTAGFSTAFKNSIIVAAATVALVVICASLAGYAFARMDFPGRKMLLKLYLSSMIISGQVILIPLFFIVKALNLYDRLLSVILTGTTMALPLSVSLFWGFFKELPVEIEESTRIDGCSRWRFFYMFVLPLSKPILATVIVLNALWSWNEYLYALTFLKSEPVRTVQLGLTNFFQLFTRDWAGRSAALAIAVIPLILLYILMQGSFIKGLTAGAVKQ